MWDNWLPVALGEIAIWLITLDDIEFLSDRLRIRTDQLVDTWSSKGEISLPSQLRSDDSYQEVAWPRLPSHLLW